MPLFFCRTSTSANILDLDNSINQEEWGPFTNHIGRIDCSHSRLPTAVPTRKPVEAGREMHVVPNSDSRSDHNRTSGKARQGKAPISSQLTSSTWFPSVLTTTVPHSFLETPRVLLFPQSQFCRHQHRLTSISLPSFPEKDQKKSN